MLPALWMIEPCANRCLWGDPAWTQHTSEAKVWGLETQQAVAAVSEKVCGPAGILLPALGPVHCYAGQELVFGHKTIIPSRGSLFASHRVGMLWKLA